MTEKGPVQKAREAIVEMKAMLAERGLVKPQSKEVPMPADKTTLAKRLEGYAAEYEKVAGRAKGVGPMVEDMRAAAAALKAPPAAPELVMPEIVKSASGEDITFPQEIVKSKVDKKL